VYILMSDLIAHWSLCYNCCFLSDSKYSLLYCVALVYILFTL